MIDVKELRVGSHYDYDDCHLARVDSINLDNEINNPVVFGKYSIDIEDINPISITDELLKEIGFVFVREEESFHTAEFYVKQIDEYEIRVFSNNDKDETFCMICFPKKEGPILIHALSIKYLHTLESLVYLTIGKELVTEET